jgi:hypothetical protein
MADIQQSLAIPASLRSQEGSTHLPHLHADIKSEIASCGWVGIGVMVALITEDADIMLIKGRETKKYRAGTLGPLGETSKQIDGMQGVPPLVEQPLSTLYRGISEELGLTEPEELDLRMKRTGGWTVNQWPRGDAYPNQWNCALSFAVHIGHDVEDLLLSINPQNDEVSGVTKLPVEFVLSDTDGLYRPGVHDWLGQLATNGLLEATEDVVPIAFDSILLGHKDIQVDHE